MAIFGSLRTLESQARDDKFVKVFNFLRSADLDGIFAKVTPECKEVVEIDGKDVFAIFQTYEAKPLAEARPEAHRKYIDVQYIHDGVERIGYADIEDISGPADYDEESDIFFTAASRLSFVELGAGQGAVFFPSDLHAPCLEATGGRGQVRKIVFKVMA